MADHTTGFRLHADAGGPSPADDAFARAIAAPLRAPERTAADFDARLMAAVRAEAAHDPHTPRAARDGESRLRRVRTWWMRDRQMRLSPFTIGAIAAGFAAVVAATTLAAVRASTGGTAATVAIAPAADTVHLVRFVFVAPDARAVSLVGDFNAWTVGETLLEPVNGIGSWSATVELPAGRHEYAFIVEDSVATRRWAPDPLAPTVRDEHDTQTSVILVGL